MKIAYFISSHGFGHAARACAVMSGIAARFPQATFEIFTRVPRWFFDQSFAGTVSYSYHDLSTDVGFIQVTSMVEDYSATIEALEKLYPLSSTLIDTTATELTDRNVQMVFCDISVLGIEAAAKAGIPSVLVENFTWDWIYTPYASLEPRFVPFISYLAPRYSQATHRIQVEPVCRAVEGAFRCRPLARATRTSPRKIREQLSIPHDAPLVMCTMGGYSGEFPALAKLAEAPSIYFILAGVERSDLPPNVRALPHTTTLFHPDLVAASDAIVGKVGYSTVAEAFYGCTQFLYLPRPLFPESAVMEHFVTEQLNGRAIPTESFSDGSWVADLPRLLEAPMMGRSVEAEDVHTVTQQLIAEVLRATA